MNDEQATSPIVVENRTSRIGDVWRRSTGAASLIVCLLFLVVYLSCYHPLTLSVSVKSMLGLYFLNAIPGYIILRSLLKFRPQSKFEMMIASLLTGMIIAPMLWYFLAWLHVGMIFMPLCCLLGVVIPIKQRWYRHLGRRLQILVRPKDAWVLWLTLGFVLLWSYQIGIVQVRSDGVAVLPYRDHRLHATFVAELLRHMPMESMPCLAGAKKWAYHHMPDVWAAMMARFTGASANQAYMYIALVMRYIFVGLGIYLALVRRFGRLGAAAGLVFALGISGVPGVSFLSYQFTAYLQDSYPTAFGIVAVCLTLYAVCVTNKQHYRPGLLLAAMMSVLLLWHKANFALVVAPAVSILIAVTLLRKNKRDYTWLLVCAVVQMTLTILRYVDLSSADVHLTFVFNGVNYMYTWWKTLDLPQVLSSWKQPIEQLPILLRWPIIYLSCATITFHIGLISFLFLLTRLWRKSGAKISRRGDLLTLMILIAAGIGFVVLPVQKDADYNVSAHIGFLVEALLLSMLGPVLLNAVSRVPAYAHRVAMPAVFMMVLMLVGVTVRLQSMNHSQVAPEDLLSPSTYAAYQYIQANSPEDAVVLVKAHEAQSTAGMLTQRRIVLERSDTWRLFYDTKKILADVNNFYAQPSSPSSMRMLRRYKVGYLVTTEPQPSLGDSNLRFEQVFHQGNTTVYRICKDDISNKLATAN